MRRLNRSLEAIGIYPLLAYVFVIPVFVLLSKLVFIKIEFADWLYFFIALIFVFKLSDDRRIEQLSLTFQKINYLKIRLIENCLISLPFVIYLFYEKCWLVGGGLLAIALLLSFYRNKSVFNRAIPTPFRKMPFEFTIGFRKSLLVLLGVVLVMVKAVQVDNFYLALFGLAVWFLIFCSYYFDPEKRYFVWMFDMNVNQFLKHKIKFGIIASLIMTLPMVSGLILVNPDKYLFVLAVECIGLLVVVSIILAKYSAYPHQINLPQLILFILSLFFPFFLFFSIPIFYTQARRKLSRILR